MRSAIITRHQDDPKFTISCLDTDGKEIERYEHISFGTSAKSNIVSVRDGSTGLGHTPYPSIDSSGSVLGKKQRGEWSKNDKIVNTLGFKYNVSRTVIENNLERISQRLEQGHHDPNRLRAGQSVELAFN